MKDWETPCPQGIATLYITITMLLLGLKYNLKSQNTIWSKITNSNSEDLHRNTFVCVWIYINLHAGRIPTNIVHRLLQTSHFKNSVKN